MNKRFTLLLMHTVTPLFVIVMAGLFVISAASTALAAEKLKSKVTRSGDADFSGTYTVMLLGSGSARDPQNVAILEKESPDAPAFEIVARNDATLPSTAPAPRVIRGMTGAEAIAEAQRFLGENVNVNQTQLSRIMGPSGDTIAYEVKPLYLPARFGTPDVVNTHYTMRGDVVRAYVQLDRDVNIALNANS